MDIRAYAWDLHVRGGLEKGESIAMIGRIPTVVHTGGDTQTMQDGKFVSSGQPTLDGPCDALTVYRWLEDIGA